MALLGMAASARAITSTMPLGDCLIEVGRMRLDSEGFQRRFESRGR